MYGSAQQSLVAIPGAQQVWFAGDATAVGTIQTLSSLGPDFGYFPNASKTVLIVKPHLLSAVNATFANANVQITD